MTGVSGLGGWPAGDPVVEQSVVVGDLAAAPAGVDGLPFLLRPGGHGPYGDPVGHALALLVELPSEVGPHGWAFADRPGRDADRAAALLAAALDALAVAAYGYSGPLVVPVLGPVSLTAQVWLARGDRAVGDPGALREVAQSAAAGVGEHLAAVRRAVPQAQPQVVLVEPLLAAVVAGALPTFSGHARLRSVEAGVVAQRLAAVVEAARAAGATTVVHVGAAPAVIGVPADAGADGLGVTVAGLGPAGWERVAEQVEAGRTLWAQLPEQGSSQCAGPDVHGQAQTLLVPWRRVGLPVDGLAGVVLLGPEPSESQSPDRARRALGGLVAAARVVAETER